MESPYKMNPARRDDYDESGWDENMCADQVVGMAYVPWQMWKDVWEPHEALSRGTQFPDLDKPFFGRDVWGCE